MRTFSFTNEEMQVILVALNNDFVDNDEKWQRKIKKLLTKLTKPV